MECPSCTTDISDFLQNPQVNRELMDVIEKLQSVEEEDTKEDEGCSEAEVSNGETEENGGCKRKETETDEKPVSTPKRKKTEAEDELPKEEAPDADDCSDILSEKETSQADATTEEAGCKRKPEAVTEKPKKRLKCKKPEAEDESLKTEEKVDEVAAPVVKAKTKRAKKKTETKAEIAKVDEEKITEEKVDENGEIDEEKVDNEDKVEAATAVVVKRGGRKASIVKEINESGLRRGRSASKVQV
jgi:E3 ubiquitin-protein ligase UHRF1